MAFSMLAVALATCAAFVSARGPALPLAPAIQGTASSFNGTAYFTQYIDHDHPELGTFQQRYQWSDEYFGGPGSPIVLFTPGEIAIDGYQGYLTNKTLTGTFAQAVKGGVIMLEHRYWGESSPYSELTTKNMQYLTLKNAIADMVHFAKTVKLPFDQDCRSNAPQAPWVLSGGSYSGALSAWTEATSPGTFWAYTATSAPVEAIFDFWTYFAPVQEGMAKNCSADVTKVINYVDSVLSGNNETAKNALKEKFGLAGLRDADFASGLQNGPWLWQETQFYTGYSAFYNWCDYVENAVDISGGNGPPSTIIPPTAHGVGLEKALNGYAAYIKYQVVPGSCASYNSVWTSQTDIGCYDTYNASSPLYTDITVGNPFDRQWTWLLCNEPFAYWQDGAPKNTPSIVSRFVTGDYWQRQCGLYFPTETDSSGTYTYGSNEGRTEAKENQYTKGWSDTNTKRLLWVNGQYDPWRDSGVSSDFRPGGPLKSTSTAPLFVIPDGIHCSDLLIHNAQANAGVQAVVNAEVKQVKQWISEFYHK